MGVLSAPRGSPPASEHDLSDCRACRRQYLCVGVLSQVWQRSSTLAMPGRSLRGRTGANDLEPAPPPVDLDQLKGLLELLVKSAARQQGIATSDGPFDGIKAQLEAALEQSDGEEQDDDAEAAEQTEAAPVGRPSRHGISGAASSTARASDSTDASTTTPECSKHEYGYAGNPSTACGVCASQWVPDCGWKQGKGNWACFPCQVYICGFECLNDHNTVRVHGNTCKAGSVIYTKEAWAELSEGRKKRKK